ncbi:MAG TPA: hypothetical protein VFV08_04610 [Puia sp.]|nr:hypothetical protein [Puia sp.]
MPILQIEHKVPSFEGWKKAFDNDPVGRRNAGVQKYQIFRPTDDRNYVIIDLHFETIEALDKMLASLQVLWGKVEGTVMTGPKTRILELVESAIL